MKKILSWLIIFILMATPTWSWAATYYGCNGCTDPTSDTCWTTDPDNTCASCSGSYTGWSTVNANGNTLYLNGCAMAYNLSTAALTIPASGTLTLLSNKQGGDAQSVDGGTLTITTHATNVASITAAIEAGGTADCIAISGSADGAARVTLLGGPITGGSNANIDGVYDSHTVGEVVVGATGSLVTITGGSNSTARGYNYTASGAGTVKMYANGTGATAAGINNTSSNAGAILTIYEGTCKGGTGASSAGCYGGTGPITLSGVNIISGTGAFGVAGKIYSAPGATNYILMPVNSSYVAAQLDGNAVMYGPAAGTGGGTVYSTGLTAESEIKSGKYVGTALGTMEAGSGGGGAWGF